jgi:hypothetical protein
MRTGGISELFLCFLLNFVMNLKLLLKIKFKPGVVAQTFNPGYMGGRVPDNCSSRPAQAKSSQDPHLNQQLGMVILACHLQATQRHTNRRVRSRLVLDLKKDPSSKIFTTKRAGEWLKW